jgi:hypothetical protein
MTINGSNGNVGIGTTSPTALLQVSASGATNDLLIGTNKLFVSASGNVGIGTTTPIYKLDVTGDIRSSLGMYNGGLIEFAGAWSNSPYTNSSWIRAGATTYGLFLINNALTKWAGFKSNSDFEINGGEFFVSSSNGYVGINQTIPSGRLEVKRATSEVNVILNSSHVNSASYTQYRINGSTGWEHGMSGLADSYKYYFSYSTFGSTNAKVTFQSDGNVGIGITSPEAKLHVSGTTGGVFEVDGAGAAGANALYVSASGRVGIGTTSTDPFRLAVSGTIGILSTLNSTIGSLYIDHAGIQSWKIGVTGSNTSTLSIGNDFGGTFANRAINIINTGDVGIGILTPSYKLDVNGTLRTTGNVLASNVINLIGTENNSAKIKAGKFLSIADDGFTVGVNYTSDSIPFSGYNLMVNGNTYNNGNIVASGNAGIGILSPSAKLHVSGTTGGVFEVDGANAVNALFVSASGRVGIGTITPTLATLQIVGNVSASSYTGSYTGSLTGALTGTASWTSNATVTLTGDVTGTGTNSVATTIGAGKVTNAMLATSSFNIGTTSISLGRASAAQTLTGVSIDGSSGNVSISNLSTQQVATANLSAGSWYTIAANAGDRASAKFTITDGTSGLHQAIHFYATAHFGTSTGAKISVLSNTYYSGPPVTGIRIITGGTYDGAMVQIYAAFNCTCSISIYDNQQFNGWVIKNAIVSTTNPGTVASFGALTTTSSLVDIGSGKSFSVSDNIYIGGATTQYVALHAGNYNSYAPTLGGTGATGNWGIYATSESLATVTSRGASTTAGITVNGALNATGDVIAYSTSDIRFKTNITPISGALDKINQIGGYEFDWIPNQEHHEFKGHDVGVIAQEIEKVLPEVVKERDNGYKAVKYEKIVPLLIEAIKEQQKQIDELKYLLQNKT